MKRIAHISDLHFGKTNPRVVLALEEDLDHFEPDLLVVSGDLTQRAKTHQFEAARGFLDGLPYARLVVPGNHDIAPLWSPLKRAFDPYGGYCRYFPPALNTFFADDQMLVIGLNTVQPFRWKEGSVSHEQINWIETLVARNPGTFHVLVAHHPLLHIEERDLQFRIHRHEPLLEMLGRVGIDLVLTGHLHEAYNGPAARAFGVTDAILVAQASTATSTRLRGHLNAYNRVTLQGPNVHIELRSFDGECFQSACVGNYERRAGLWRSIVPEAPGPVLAAV